MSRKQPDFVETDDAVAYLFTLRRERHPLPRAWAAYFAGCPPNTYVVHAHTDPTFGAPKSNSSKPSVFSHTKINRSVHVERMGYSMVQARLYLLRHAIDTAAANGRPMPRWFAFFSESCAPVASCRETNSYLASRAGKSFIKIDRPVSEAQRTLQPSWVDAFHLSACRGCRAAGIAPEHFRHSAGWVTLWWEHALLFLENEAKYEAPFRSWSWEKVVAGIADETYWATISTVHQLPLWPQLLTYMESGDAKSGHPALFRPSDVQRIVKAAQQTPRHFFARKFETTVGADTALVQSRAQRLG
mmetsp:Transcript_34837/g.76621  ORF Transcript_34837/g.76621 Transcript_34837/m.76621 type:complete len:301 (-) Transcript_34837:1189-2091(-)